MRSKLVVVGVLVAGLLVWFLWPSDTNTNHSGIEEESQLNPIEIAENNLNIVDETSWVSPTITFDSYESQYGGLPPSLEGTHIPFNLQINEYGELIVNENVRRLFDYFFTTDGEEPIATILLRIEELIIAHLPESAQSRALEILHQYSELKQAEIELAKQLDIDAKASGEKTSLAELRRLQRDLRATTLDPEVYQAFYGVEDKRDDYALKRVEIRKNKSLSEEERRAALEAIEASLPLADQEHLQAEREANRVYADVEKAKAEGASEAEIYHIREQVFGAEVADRYTQADNQKAQWDTRIDIYREEREGILNTTGLSEDDKNYQIEQLRQQHFEGNELKRIPVIDRMKDSQQ